MENDDTAFLGQPRGLAYLAFTQVWERFSFYGMTALLTLYMIHQLLLPGHVEHVLGFEGFRRGVEAVFGPLTALALASQIFGLYTGFVSLTPLLGAWLGDKVLGQRMTSIIGLLLMTVGHFLMAFEAMFLWALLALVIGAGCLKGNMYAQVGNLYGDGDRRQTAAFSIFLIALNTGAFFAPLVCGTLGEVYGWHYGFGVAGFGMLIGLVIYVSGWKYLPPDRFHAARDAVQAPLGRADWRAVAAVLLMLVPVLFIITAANQAYNLVIVWAEAHVNRSVGSLTMPVTWLLTLDGLMTIVGILITFPLWKWLAARGREPDTMQKFAVAGVFVTLAYVVLALGAGWFAVVPLAVVVLFFVLFDLNFGWTDPPANAFIARFAPAALVTTMMSVGLMFNGGFPFFTAGWLGRFYEPLGPVNFWWLHAGIAATGSVLALVLRPLVAHLLGRDEMAAADAAGAVYAKS
ncbi:MAG: peptide MFS transporter [Sandarakinorhabdus sp.]|nr:peptide MFS transporter [Sandarakinorhabdus sp.]